MLKSNVQVEAVKCLYASRETSNYVTHDHRFQSPGQQARLPPSVCWVSDGRRNDFRHTVRKRGPASDPEIHAALTIG